MFFSFCSGFPHEINRLNWGHTCITTEPERCECVCPRAEGDGKIIIRNTQAKDQGAYTCEAMNNKGNLFAIPDAILEREPTRGRVEAKAANDPNDQPLTMNGLLGST